MIERPQENPRHYFERGMLVKIRGDLRVAVRRNFERIMGKDGVRRIIAIEETPGHGALAWLGPLEMSQQNVDDFQPDLAEQDPRYQDVFGVLTDNLRPAHN